MIFKLLFLISILFYSRSEVSDCGRYLIVSASQSCEANTIFFADLSKLPDQTIKGKLEMIPVTGPMTDVEYEVCIYQKSTLHKLFILILFNHQYVTNTGSVSVFRTNLDAPNYRLIAIDFEHPERENWKTIVEASETDVLDWAVCVNKDKLLTCYVHDVKVNILFVDSKKLESY